MLSALLFAVAPDALAGGVGIVATGGAHNEALYYYERVDQDGNRIPDPDLYPQFKANQVIPNFVVTPVGEQGKISITTTQGMHVLADVLGYFVPAAEHLRNDTGLPISSHDPRRPPQA